MLESIIESSPNKSERILIPRVRRMSLGVNIPLNERPSRRIMSSPSKLGHSNGPPSSSHNATVAGSWNVETSLPTWPKLALGDSAQRRQSSAQVLVTARRRSFGCFSDLRPTPQQQRNPNSHFADSNLRRGSRVQPSSNVTKPQQRSRRPKPDPGPPNIPSYARPTVASNRHRKT